MELGSKSLQDWIAERNADENAVVDREKMYTWFMAICSGVKYLHGNDGNCILHGNLKPSNVFLGPQGSIKISDVGGIVKNEYTVNTVFTANTVSTVNTVFLTDYCQNVSAESISLYLPNDLQEDIGKTHLDVFSLG